MLKTRGFLVNKNYLDQLSHQEIAYPTICPIIYLLKPPLGKLCYLPEWKVQLQAGWDAYSALVGLKGPVPPWRMGPHWNLEEGELPSASSASPSPAPGSHQYLHWPQFRCGSAPVLETMELGSPPCQKQEDPQFPYLDDEELAESDSEESL